VTGKRGFTLIELLVVLAIIGVLLTLAAPRYFSSVDRSKEAVLRADLHRMREAIQQYYADKGKYPEKLETLVTERYLREMPRDPITERSDTWIPVPPPDGTQTGVYDVHSGAPGNAKDGSPYKDW
jgi:general secretion pathway protein G